MYSSFLVLAHLALAAGAPLEISPLELQAPVSFHSARSGRQRGSSHLRLRSPASYLERQVRADVLEITECQGLVGDLTSCRFDHDLGTGICGTSELASIRKALAKDNSPSKVIRQVSPLPILPQTAYPKDSVWPALAHADIAAVHEGKLFVVDNFLTPEQAAKFRHFSDDRQQATSGIRTGPTRHCEFRKSHYWSVYQLKSEMPEVVSKILDVTKTKPEEFESMQLTQYNPGDFYSDHYDAEPCNRQVPDPSGKGADALQAAEECKSPKRRKVTVLMYLNEGMSGGGTFFPRLGKNGVRVMPKEGRAIIFHPTSPDGRTDPDLVHGSEETSSGQKYVLQQWITHGAYGTG